MCPILHLRFFAFKTAPLAPELQVSIGSSPHLCFFQAKQRLLDQNYKFLWVPDLTCPFVSFQPSSVVLCTHNSGIMTRINSLYWSQTPPVVLRKQSSMISTRITSLHGSQTSPVVLCMQNNVISIGITSFYGSQTSPVVLCMQNNVISIRITSLYGSQPSSVVFA